MRGHGHGLGPVERRVRLCKVEVLEIGTMHPGRGVLLNTIFVILRGWESFKIK